MTTHHTSLYDNETNPAPAMVHSELVESWNSFQRNLWVLKIITKPLGKVKSHFEKSINVQNSVLPTDLLTGIYEPEDVEFFDLDFD